MSSKDTSKGKSTKESKTETTTTHAKRAASDKDKDKDKDKEPTHCTEIQATRSKCKACKYSIPKGDPKFGTKTGSDDDATWSWCHLRCADVDLFSSLDMRSLDGYDSIPSAKKKIVDDIAAKKTRRAQSRASKSKEDKDDDVDYYLWTIPRLKEETEKRKMWADDKLCGNIRTPRKEDFVHSLEKDDELGGTGDIMKNPPDPPKPKKRRSMNSYHTVTFQKRKKKKDDDEERKSPAPKKPRSAAQHSDEAVKMKKLKSDLEMKTVEQLKDSLRLNDQKTTGNKKDLILRVVDGMMYGAAPRCPKCGAGILRVKYKTKYGHNGQGKFRCPGYFDDDEFKSCDYNSSSEKRKAWATS